MSGGEWPKSILPADRAGDPRWDQLLDGICKLWRELGPGERITGLSMAVSLGQFERVCEVTSSDPSTVHRYVSVAGETASQDGAA